eukprot:Gb_40950 [translate_table: standard]
MAGPPKPVDVEITISSARDLKNVNWREGDLRPYAVAWIDPEYKVSTKVDEEGDTSPSWNEKLTIPVNKPLEDAELTIEIVHQKPSELTKPLVGTARIPLAEVLDEVGFDEKLERTLKLRRPSGRPQGKLDVAIRLREKRWPAPQYPPPAGYAQPYTTREWQGYPPQGYPQPGYPPNYPSYAPPPPGQYSYPSQPYASPPVGYPNPYGNPYSQSGGSPYYDNPVGSSGGYVGASAPPAPGYIDTTNPEKQKGSSKFGLGTGLAVGAVAGVLGGLALDEAVHYGEEKIEDNVAEKVESDLAAQQGFDDYGGDDYGGYDDDY